MNLLRGCLEKSNDIEVKTIKRDGGEDTSVADYEGNPSYLSKLKHPAPDWSKINRSLSQPTGFDY